MKLFYLTNLLSPYRIEWMNMLADAYDIHAFYVTATEKTRDDRWLNDITPRFTTEKVAPDDGGRFDEKQWIRRRIEENYDIYVIDGYSSKLKLQTIFKLRKADKKLFINIDGIDLQKKGDPLGFIKKMLKRRVFRSGATFLCGSRMTAKMILDEGADPGRVHVHPFTSLHREEIITAGQKKPLQREAKAKLSLTGCKLVLAVGRFIPLKRYDTLLEAWQGMPDDCRLILIGGGEERAQYEALIERFGLKGVSLLDFMPHDELTEYYLAADLFVHPSSTETWGLVFNEAMAKGCPVITTDRCIGGVELVEDGEQGFIVGVGDSETLHERMLRILSDNGLREQMTEKAIEKIEPYTYENLAKMHLDIFRDTAR